MDVRQTADNLRMEAWNMSYIAGLFLPLFFATVSQASSGTESVPSKLADVPKELHVSIRHDFHVTLNLPVCISCGESWRSSSAATVKESARTFSNFPSLVSIISNAGFPKESLAMETITFPPLAPGNYVLDLVYGVDPQWPQPIKQTLTVYVEVTP